MANNGKVTLAVLGHKMDELSALVREHVAEDKAMFKEIQESLDGCDEYPGVRGRLDRIEQSNVARKRHLGYLWAACGGIIAERFARYIPFIG